ncbi:MAG: beta-N-acetylglucosaminidase domain-containing protein [bacterium]
MSASYYYKGVIEGFYGRPWTFDQRIRLLDHMKVLGLNTFIYAPKSDIFHRKEWRTPYPSENLNKFSRLIEHCRNLGINFVFCLSPGVDIKYSRVFDQEKLKEKFKSIKEIGADSFAILFDDISDQLMQEDRNRFSSLAEAHKSLANCIYEELKPAHFFVCPVYYSYERCADREQLVNYIKEMGAGLNSDINVFWTGNRTISDKILPSHIKPVINMLGRRPVIWDNYFADDYSNQKIFLGPLYGRHPHLNKFLKGFFMNPSCFFEMASLQLYYVSEYFKNPLKYKPKAVYEKALFKMSGPKGLGILKALGDIYHAPFVSTAFYGQTYQNFKRGFRLSEIISGKILKPQGN